MEELQKRKPNRLQNFDYSTNGAYFITICTQGKKCILSKIVGGDALIAPKITLTKYGQIAEKYIKNIPVFCSSSTRRKLRKNMVKQQIQGYLFNKSTEYGERRCA